MIRSITLLFFFIFILSAYAEIKLEPVHPDEPIEYTFNERFSIKNALESLEMTKSALESFKKLTKESENLISKEKINVIGNTDDEIQILGFTNWIASIEGTLRKQEYLLKKLRYELTQEKVKSGKVNKEQLKQAQKEYLQAEKSFQIFWDSYSIAD